MPRVSLSDLERRRDDYDAHVAAAAGIDRFCSGSEWILSAREAWGEGEEAVVLEDEPGWLAFLRGREQAEPVVMHGFEAMWGLASPLVGRDPAPLAAWAAGELAAQRWNILLLHGLRDGSPLLRAVSDEFGRLGPVRPVGHARRQVASLRGGLGGFLRRRSAKLRSNLRSASRRARDAGVTFEPASEAADAVARAAAVELRSWKGAEGTGLASPDMRAFYEAMAARLRARRRLRAIFARKGGEDVGYILGGVRGGTYRGFQFSYDARFRSLSLGSLLQVEQIAELTSDGIEEYDLGVDLPYKRRWADATVDTTGLAILRR